MKNRETLIIKIAAAIAAAPRWVTALTPADQAKFLWGEAIWWSVISAVSSLAFAVVETWAAYYMVKAWSKATGPSKHVLLRLWVLSLVFLTGIMAPAVFTNAKGLEFSSLPLYVLIPWSLFMAGSTFLTIGGTSYADGVLLQPETAPTQEPITVSDPSPAVALPEAPKLRGGTITKQVLEYMAANPEAKPRAIADALGANIGTVKAIRAKAKANGTHRS